MWQKNPQWSDTVNVTFEQCVFWGSLSQDTEDSTCHKRSSKVHISRNIVKLTYGIPKSYRTRSHTHIRSRNRVKKRFLQLRKYQWEKRSQQPYQFLLCNSSGLHARVNATSWPPLALSFSSWGPLSLSPNQTSVLPEWRYHGPPLLTHLLLILGHSKWSLSSLLTI